MSPLEMGSPRLSSNALKVLEVRYLRLDAERKILETPEELFGRVARAVAQGEVLVGNGRHAAEWDSRFHDLLTSLDFLPNSPTLMNAGTPVGQLSACFVIPVEDTMEGIFDGLKLAALVQRTGGGTGFSFSKLRPKGDPVASTGGSASGPVSFMRIFDCATENIKQGGRRRGANMGILRVDHPDILEFIDAKSDGVSFRNFNLSVGVTDAFMDAARYEQDYALSHPVTGRLAGTLSAKRVLDAIVDAAWRTGDPGLIFLDAVNRANPTPHLGPIDATNPCGEVPLLPFEACNLGSIHLAHALKTHSDGRLDLDWQKLRETVHVAVRFLDDVIEVSRSPSPEIERATRATRKIGLGVMGFAELLIRLGVPYDSGEAVAIAEKIMSEVAKTALETSAALASERGVFPSWKGSVYEARGVDVRNATRTAIAPTGTLSILAGTSSSIEPLFALAYRRNEVLGGETLFELNPLFIEYLERFQVDRDSVLREVGSKGRLKDVASAPDALKRLFVTALEIPPGKHLEIQAAFQRHVDNSVSKTINLPEDATREDIARAYEQAFELGLKGITVYRYGSKSAQVLQLGLDEEALERNHGSKCDPYECRL